MSRTTFNLNKIRVSDIQINDDQILVQYMIGEIKYGYVMPNTATMGDFEYMIKRSTNFYCKFYHLTSNTEIKSEQLLAELNPIILKGYKIFESTGKRQPTFVQLNYSAAYRIFYPTFQCSIKNLFKQNMYITVSTSSCFTFMDVFTTIHYADGSAGQIQQFIGTRTQTIAVDPVVSILDNSCAFVAATNIARVLKPGDQSISDRFNLFQAYMEPVYNITPSYCFNSNILSIQFLLACVYDLQVCDDYMITSTPLNGIEPLCLVTYTPNDGSLGHHVVLFRNGSTFQAVDNKGNFEGDLSAFHACGYVYPSSITYKKTFLEQTIHGSIRLKDVDQFKDSKVEDIIEYIKDFAIEYTDEIEDSRQIVINALTAFAQDESFAHTKLVGNTIFTFMRSPTLGTDKYLTSIIKNRTIYEHKMENHQFAVEVARYLNNLQPAIDHMPAPSSKVPDDEEHRQLELIACNDNIAISDFQSDIKHAKFICFNKDKVPIFRCTWCDTVESIHALADVDWAWLYAENCETSPAILKELYQAYIKVHPKPPGTLQRWPHDYNRAFFASLQEMMDSPEKDQQMVQKAYQTGERIRARRNARKNASKAEESDSDSVSDSDNE